MLPEDANATPNPGESGGSGRDLSEGQAPAEAGNEAQTRSRSEVQHSEAVVRLYSQHQRWLFGYLMTLLGNPEDAEDVMQEVSVVMWREHQNFELGTNFTGWLSVIAYHQVQKFWRQRKKKATYLDVAVIEQLASVITKDREVVDIRRQFWANASRHCRQRSGIWFSRFTAARGPGRFAATPQRPALTRRVFIAPWHGFGSRCLTVSSESWLQKGLWDERA